MSTPRGSQPESESSSADEYYKRKREEKEETFRKSRKVVRTPPKIAQDRDMEDIKKMLSALTGEMGMVKEKLNKLDTIEEQQGCLLQEVKELRQENRVLRSENEKLKEKIGQLEKSVRILQNKEKKKNIVIRGAVMVDKENLEIKVKELLQEKIKVTVDLEHVRLVETKKKEQLIVGQLKNMQQKIQVMKAKRNLAGSKIFIDDDLTWEERNVQMTIRKIRDEERKNGKRVKIGYRKMILEGEEWIWSEIENKLVRKTIQGQKN